MDKFITQIKLIFIVFGARFEPQNLTKAINVTPTNFWTKGDKIHSYSSLRKDNVSLPVRNESGWEYSLGFIETLDFQVVSKSFEDVFSSKSKYIKDFIEKNNLESTVNIVVEIANGQTPSLNLNKKFISLVQLLEAEIDIDTYIIEDN